jgi:hypothetical protein
MCLHFRLFESENVSDHPFYGLFHKSPQMNRFSIIFYGCPGASINYDRSCYRFVYRHRRVSRCYHSVATNQYHPRSIRYPRRRYRISCSIADISRDHQYHRTIISSSSASSHQRISASTHHLVAISYFLYPMPAKK